MADDLPPIFVKKVKKCPHVPHGGAWKVAFADFMTAMMAFFLLLWLLSSSNEETQKAIASYFQDPSIMTESAMGEGMGGEGQGASNAIIDLGGANDPIIRPKSESEDEAKAKAEQELDIEALKALKKAIEDTMEASEKLKKLQEHLKIEMTPKGLKIMIIDTDRRSMFGVGDDRTLPHMKRILGLVAKLVNTLPNKITITGHTDQDQLSRYGQTYTNWELSADRANAARRDMVLGGLKSDKLMSVKGLADSYPLDPDNPYNSNNRRVGILVLTKEAENDMRTLNMESVPE